ncbi:TlpA family protein disulfide reductase [Aquimarina pacifica]|uniref:TlpA family protein disulfide reductase n=1 Tax=Aquimarina pacifica TaxID=1296415 RepID=UPI00046F89EE|nr:TlpA disulfide reductase family protein [Aquimarina pacifica]
MSKLFKCFVLVVAIILGVYFMYIRYFSISDGERAPDFDTALIDGAAFKLSDLQGKYVLLDFWGSWCGPCLKEIPELVELHQKHPDKLIIVTIALEKDSFSWKKVASKYGFTWKNQIVDQNKFVMMSSIARKYGVTEIPAKFLISPEGKLIGRRSFKQIYSLFSVKSNSLRE